MTRAERLSALALAQPAELDRLWTEAGINAAYAFLAAPTCTAVMAQAHAAGDGPLFNLGEVVVTRCVVRLLPDGPDGVAIVPGRARRHAVRAAVLEALARSDGAVAQMVRAGIAALQEAHATRTAARVAEAARSAAAFGTLLSEAGA